MEKERTEKLIIAALSNFGGEKFGKSIQFCQIWKNLPPPKFCIMRYIFFKKKTAKIDDEALVQDF